MPRNQNAGIVKPAKSSLGPKSKYYAVRVGRDGFSGVLSTWEECSSHVKGVKGAIYKSFKDYEQAAMFANGGGSSQPPSNNQEDRAQMPSSSSDKARAYYAIRVGKDGFNGVTTTWEACKSQVTGVIGAQFKKFRTYEEALAYCEVKPSEPSVSKNGNSSGRSNAYLAKLAAVPVFPDVAKPQMQLTVYTDGACVNNGKDNAKAGYGVFFERNSPFNLSERLPGHQTNQRAEMTAVLAAMRIVRSNELVLGGGSLTIKTDSKYTKDGIEKWINGWKEKGWTTVAGSEVKNMDLWFALDMAKLELEYSDVTVTLKWVKGHSGEPGNEAADRLAVAGISKLA